MCFSAAASFTAAAGLMAIGAVTLSKAKSKKEVPFAMIPLLFGVQQFIEGTVWVSLDHSIQPLLLVAPYAFCVFAYVLWPVYIPFAVLKIERQQWRRQVLWAFQSLGLLISAYFLYFILHFTITAKMLGHCIAYTHPEAHIVAITFVYAAIISGSLLAARSKIINWFGSLTAIFLAITFFFYANALVSVWCFFSAILSGIVYFYFSRKEKRVG